MKLAAGDLRQLAETAVSAARAAGRMIASAQPRNIERKSAAGEAAQLVTEVDRRSEQMILDRLKPTLEPFGLGLLTEERDDDRSRFDAEHFWCVDPLDGTLPYVEGIPGHAVSIALVRRDGTPLIGVIHDPVSDSTTHAVVGSGLLRDGTPWRPPSDREPRVLSVFADRSFLRLDDHDAVVEALAQHAHERGLDGGVVVEAAAGAVMNAWGVLTHAPSCYFKFPAPSGGGSLWDFAATACLFAEAGAVATDMQGAPLDLNRADSTLMGHRGVVFASDPALAECIRSIRIRGPAGRA